VAVKVLNCREDDIMTRWGFVGLGQMGRPMAARIASAGLPLTVLSRRPDLDAAARELGAAVALTVDELAAAVDVVSVCVRDDAQVRGLMLNQGLLAAARPGSVVLIHSTVAPHLCLDLAARAKRASVLDAPVSGLPVRARAGTLTFFVGGDADALERARPGLDAMGRTIVRTGPVGSGQITKILNNLVSLSTVAAVAEALRLATRQGLDPRAVRQALGSASADSFTLRHWDFFAGEWLADGPDNVTTMVAKDLGLAAALDSAEPSIMAEAAQRTLHRYVTESAETDVRAH
jgi:3-hydroxyisobutyrate dehydrogenase-like beta-hydroxyacid dehydrogenase